MQAAQEAASAAEALAALEAELQTLARKEAKVARTLSESIQAFLSQPVSHRPSPNALIVSRRSFKMAATPSVHGQLYVAPRVLTYNADGFFCC